jgi:Zn-dependent protease with chaperone function
MDRYPDSKPASRFSWRGPKLVALTVLLPLAFAALGYWEQGRSVELLEQQTKTRILVEQAVERLQTAMARDPQARIRDNQGRPMSASYTLQRAEERLEQLETEEMVASIRGYLPPVAMWAGGLAALLGATGLLAAVLIGRAGRASRARLLASFNLLRRALPFHMALQILLIAAASLSVLGFEGAALWHSGRLSSGDVKLMAVAGMFGVFAIILVVGALSQLRKALRLFTPEPLPLLGREVGRDEAAGLWRTVLDLSARCDAQPPEHIVVGLTDGYFVTSSDIVLRPEERRISGRTLHVPLPHLALTDREEAAAIIGHELGHFSGEDTEYSRRFVPIYAGVSRSLEAVAESEANGNALSLVLTRPALMLGLFVMEQFDHAVHHWSRQREFAADAVGARLTSNKAAASALLRSSAIHPRIQDVLGEVAEKPANRPADLLPAILRAAAERGLDDPRIHLEEQQPHPTDTHPPTSQRIAALGLLTPSGPDAEVLARATRPVLPGEATALDACFADPGAIGRALTDDFAGALQQQEQAVAEALERAAAAVQDEREVFENTGLATWIFCLMGGGMLALGAGLIGWGLLEEGRTEMVLIGGATMVPGLAMLLLGLFFRRRGRHPVMVLTPTGFRSPGLAAEVPWLDVADFTVFSGNALRAEFLIALGRPMPRKASRRAKVDASARVVILPSYGLRGLKPTAYADLLGTYWRAAIARAELAQRRATAPATPEAEPAEDDTMIRAPGPWG